MTVKSKKLILAILFILIAIGLIIGYFLYNKKHKDILDAKGIAVAAPELYSKFQSDSSFANKTYTNQVLEISGTVEKVSVNQQNQHIVLIKTGIDGGYVNCTLEGSFDSTLLQGSFIIKGLCNGYIGGDADMGLPGDVVLSRCYLEKK